MTHGNAVDDGLAVTFGQDDFLGVGQVERNVEGTAIRLVVRPEKDVLARFDLGHQVAARNRIFLEIVGVVGEVAASDVDRAVGGVEELEPGILLTEIVLEVIGIDHQVFVQAHGILALCSGSEGKGQADNRQKQFEMFHTLLV